MLTRRRPSDPSTQVNCRRKRPYVRIFRDNDIPAKLSTVGSEAHRVAVFVIRSDGNAVQVRHLPAVEPDFRKSLSSQLEVEHDVVAPIEGDRSSIPVDILLTFAAGCNAESRCPHVGYDPERQWR